MTTVGGNRGLELLPLGLAAFPMPPKRSGASPDWATLARPEGWPGAPWSPPRPPAFEGSDLLRPSVRLDEEEVGVSVGDWFESREEGEAVPSLLSLFFLLPLA
jgi:hypothetical protein